MSRQNIYLDCGDDVLGETGHTSSRRGTVKGVYADINTCWGQGVRLDADITVRDKQDVNYYESKIRFWKEKGNEKKILAWKQKLKDAEIYNKEMEEKESVIVRVKPNWNIKQLYLDIEVSNYSSVRLAQEDLVLLQFIKIKDPEAIIELMKRYETDTLDKIAHRYLAKKV